MIQKKAEGVNSSAILFYFGANANYLWAENNSFYPQRKNLAPGRE